MASDGQIPLLKEYVVQEEEGKKASKFDKPKSTGTPVSLTKAGTFKCVPSHAGLRFTAWVLDHVILGTLWFVLFGGVVTFLEQQQPVDPEIAKYVWTGFSVVFIFFYLLYFTMLMGLKAQTFGQWFAGIMIVREGGLPVLMGRALLWTVFYILFGATTALFATIMPGGRAIQDMLTRTRVIRITVRELA